MVGLSSWTFKECNMEDISSGGCNIVAIMECYSEVFNHSIRGTNIFILEILASRMKEVCPWSTLLGLYSLNSFPLVFCTFLEPSLEGVSPLGLLVDALFPVYLFLMTRMSLFLRIICICASKTTSWYPLLKSSVSSGGISPLSIQALSCSSLVLKVVGEPMSN